MREILFKAKRLDNGEWVQGYIVRHPSAVQIGESSPLREVEDKSHG